MTDDFFGLVSKEEPLREELRPYIQHVKGMVMVNSPLVQQIFVDLNRCALLNAQYDYKTKAIAKARTEGDWRSYIWLHERPYRFDALMEVLDENPLLRGHDKWCLVGDVWTDSENIWQNLHGWRHIWNLREKKRPGLMDSFELDVLDSLPDVVTIYRGTGYRKSVNGLSWTLDKEKAEWFANRFRKLHKSAYLAYGEVPKADVKAFFDCRNEREIVTTKPKILKIEEI